MENKEIILSEFVTNNHEAHQKVLNKLLDGGTFRNHEKTAKMLRFIYDYSPEHEAPAKDLTQYTEVSPASTSQWANAFENLGVIERRASAEDRRAAVLKVTDKFIEKAKEEEKKSLEPIMNVLNELPEDEQKVVLNTIEKINEEYKKSKKGMNRLRFTPIFLVPI